MRDSPPYEQVPVSLTRMPWFEATARAGESSVCDGLQHRQRSESDPVRACVSVSSATLMPLVLTRHRGEDR